MTWTYKHTRSPGSTMVADYECCVHGRFERTVARDEQGDPPGAVWCQLPDDYGSACLRISEWRPTSALTRVKRVTAARRGKDPERPPGVLDWQALAYDEKPPEEVMAAERKKDWETIRKFLRDELRK